MPGIATRNAGHLAFWMLEALQSPLRRAQPIILLPSHPALQQPPGSLARALSDPSFLKTSKVAIDSAKKRARMQPGKE